LSLESKLEEVIIKETLKKTTKNQLWWFYQLRKNQKFKK